MKEKLIARLAELEAYLASGKWADPYSPSYTNGYDKAIREEIEWLRGILQ